MFARSLLRKNHINSQSMEDAWNSTCILLTHIANLAFSLMLGLSRTKHWIGLEPFRPWLRWKNSMPVPSGTWGRQSYKVGKGVRHRKWYWCEPGLSSGNFSETCVPSSRLLCGTSCVPTVTSFTVSVAELFQEATDHSCTHGVRAPAPLFSLRGQVWLLFFSLFSRVFSLFSFFKPMFFPPALWNGITFPTKEETKRKMHYLDAIQRDWDIGTNDERHIDPSGSWFLSKYNFLRNEQ